MDKLSKKGYLEALEEANQSITEEAESYHDDNALGFDSEAEQLAASMPPKVRKSNTQPLTEQPRLFVTLVVQGKTRREAYRTAYNSSMSDSAISSNASKLAADPRIASMINAAWDETIEHLADDVASTKRYVLRKLVALSKDAKQEGSRIKALELLGKSLGLFIAQEEKAEKAVAPEQL
jgi:hypothetical protein